MLRRYAKPLVVWTLTSVAAFAQQPPGYRSPQPGVQQTPVQQPVQQPQSPNKLAQQNGPEQITTLSQPGTQPRGTQDVVQRTASAANGIGSSPNDRQAMEQQLAAQQAALVAQLAKMPFEPLNEPQQQYLDQVLDVWEKRTAAIQRYKCNFKRYIFDPAQNTGNDAAAKGEGAIRFMQPDKGLFRVDKLEFFNGRDEKQAAVYRENERQKYGEYWLCDGDYVHILDRNEKKCLKVQLPPDMRGQKIHLSPLPFMFGVKAAEIKNRYWVRPLAPPPGSSDVWLETYPKRPDDAGNYSRVQIVLDPADVLPKGLVVFLPNWRPDQQHREIYEFSERDKDWTMLDQMKDKLFKEEFIPKTLPKDWEIVVEPYQAPQAGPGQPSVNPQQLGQPQGGQPLPGQSQQIRQAQSPVPNPARPNQPAAKQPLR